MKRITLIAAQIDFRLGDIPAQVQTIKKAALEAKQQFRADIIVFPELSLTGYPPEDLLLRPAFLLEVEHALIEIAQFHHDITLVLGYPRRSGDHLFNSVGVIQQGRVQCVYDKQKLPNYGVFDEKRYFTEGRKPVCFSCKGLSIGLLICEDLWHVDPILQAKKAGAQLIIVPNASPFDADKFAERQDIIQQRIAETGLPIVYVNSVGAQDELVFDGGSMAFNEKGEMIARADFFKPMLMPVIFNAQPHLPPMPSRLELIYQALVIGLRDYIDKNKAPGVLLGLSGGIDSALTLAIAVDALSSARVEAVMMPSCYTSSISLDDAATLAKNFNVNYSIISIDHLFAEFNTALTSRFASALPDKTEENLQSRIRGTLLMAIANKTNKMVLTTSNKSETAVGYATLYGDTAGAFAVLKDVPKTLVYELVAHRNRMAPLIPERVITRAPSAELASNQTDQDTLPPYAILDAIIALHVNENKSETDIIAAGFEQESVRKVLALIQAAEYKRRQMPPGTRISARAFGRDWRYPLTR